MVETLTESFCERCGTRYEFKAPTRLNPLRKTRGFIGGLKNYLTSQDALSDAMGDAMRTEEDQLAGAQLEAFHESFNFCIGCRQYACLNCWNDAEGRCRTCAPVAGTDDLAERLAASFAAGSPTVAAEPVMDSADLERRLGGTGAWPSADLSDAAQTSNGHPAPAWPSADGLDCPTAGTLEPEPILADELEPEPEPVLADEVEPEPIIAHEIEPEPFIADVEPEPIVAQELEREPEPVLAREVELEPMLADAVEPAPEPILARDVEPAPQTVVADAEVGLEDDVEPVAAEDEHPALRVVAWEDDAAFELEPVVAEVEPEPEPVVAEVEPEPEPVVAEVEPEPVAGPGTPEGDVPIAASVEEEAAAPEPPRAPRVPPIRETILRIPRHVERPTAPAPAADERVAAQADSPELAARRAQLDLLGLGDPDEGPVAPDRPAVIPYRSRGAAPTQIELAARGAFWEASAREVAGAGASVGVQSCGQCGLSLSASARFCRRCGTRQAQPA